MDTLDRLTTSDELQERLQALTGENFQLHNKNERLFAKVGFLEGRLGHLASSNTDLSWRLVQSEEEKLKISKELVGEKIQTNKMREHFEEETFELKNKILNRDSVITELEMERDKLSRELQSAEARLKVGEKSGQDLTEDHATLKESFLALAQAHDKELAQGEELSAELLALAQAQDALRRQLAEQERSVQTTAQGLHGELDRVRALISRMSCNRVQALMCSQSQAKEVEEENSKLQLQVKELNEEYRARLVCYVRDLSGYLDGLGDGQAPSEGAKVRTFVESMLQDVRSSYRVREEQLASAARSYKKRLQKITKTHHALLIAYRVQREQILATPENGLDPGPPEAHFSLAPTELRDETESELQHLRQDKARLEGQLQAAREEVSFEKERALLITRATVAEAQVLELQDYIDNPLGRSEIHHQRYVLCNKQFVFHLCAQSNQFINFSVLIPLKGRGHLLLPMFLQVPNPIKFGLLFDTSDSLHHE
ncbi:hypothetical protein F2P81_022202 [Scophthalmus maximus]|uniref:DUF4472 domain-containing protein n=1 Tax=Scophthalmus maximus TaxID=52904 RepID=A0A6A4S2D1_SCOMX|nr:hypothetical protein F2P81_022202 [Scophthalmus maximus]